MKISARGNVIFSVIAVLLILLAAGLYLRPYYEHYALKKSFSVAMSAGDFLYSLAQTHYIRKGTWPNSASDLRPDINQEQLISDWVIGNKAYSCEIAYGRGDHPFNDIVCSARGKGAKVLLYQILLSERQLNQRYCWALKTNKTANQICTEAGGVFSHLSAGQSVPYRVYRVEREPSF
ncbi:MAG: hypothetical protein J6V32_02800 [Elusimicrobiaceae bacterium]|nr:hypothetical protein [Elusimicrobiaceae bacterium]